MSGIYIPGISMPESCYGNCPFFTQIPPGEDHGLINYCCLENWKQPRTPMPFSVEEAKHGRQDFCPLIHVPPHRRLIDADKLYEKFVLLESEAMGALQTTGIGSVDGIKWSAILTERTGYKFDIVDAPTVIQASKEEADV